jgi:hypothetical protein
MVPFQNCVRWSRLPTKMAAKLKIEKRGDEILIVHCCFSVSPPRDHPCQVWFNLVQRFQRRSLNVIFYQNMPNLHNRYISAERKIKLLYFKPECAKFELCKHNDELFSIYYRIFYELWTFADFDRRKISQKNTKYMLNYSLPYSCS